MKNQRDFLCKYVDALIAKCCYYEGLPNGLSKVLDELEQEKREMNTQEIRERNSYALLHDKRTRTAGDTIFVLCDEIDRLRAEHGLTINEHQREPMDTGVLYHGERILLETGYQKFADKLRKLLRDKLQLFPSTH